MSAVTQCPPVPSPLLASGLLDSWLDGCASTGDIGAEIKGKVTIRYATDTPQLLTFTRVMVCSSLS